VQGLWPELDAGKSGSFKIGRDIGINRLGFGDMSVTGPGVWRLSSFFDAVPRA
jgi:hypothetical protein